VFNIQKAVGRLNFAPKQKEIRITDIKKGLGEFTPLPDKPVSFTDLKGNLKKAGYVITNADITVVGKLAQENGDWFIIADTSSQKFALTGKLTDLRSGDPVELTGNWTTVETQETIEIASIRSMASASHSKKPFDFVKASFGPSDVPAEPLVTENESKILAPIRGTSPGLTVYHGGAITPRFYLTRQHLGNLVVWRQALDLAVSYTPTQRAQLELEIPFSRTSFDDQANNGSGSGLGNIKVWAKYRFFRKVKTWGDRQASARFGLELPTGSTDSPSVSEVNAPAFVRAQLGSINGGLSPHFDVTFSQAGGRFIFGGNAEGIFRTERNGFRMGHEIRVNTDLEYVLLPRDYKEPGHELFLILETTFVSQARGRLNGIEVPGSSSNVYYLSPGLQFTAKPNFVIEGSIQLPVARSAGPLILRTDFNLLLGVKYLF
jgi:hypothetical protein